MHFSVAETFSRTPGPRLRSEGTHSGEELCEVLHGQFVACLQQDELLVVDLDGTCGYSTAFLEEAFGGLVRRFKIRRDVLFQVLQVKSLEEPYLCQDVESYIVIAAWRNELVVSAPEPAPREALEDFRREREARKALRRELQAEDLEIAAWAEDREMAAWREEKMVALGPAQQNTNTTLSPALKEALSTAEQPTPDKRSAVRTTAYALADWLTKDRVELKQAAVLSLGLVVVYTHWWDPRVSVLVWCWSVAWVIYIQVTRSRERRALTKQLKELTDRLNYGSEFERRLEKTEHLAREAYRLASPHLSPGGLFDNPEKE